MKKIIVTTSWDDGAATDTRMATLLKSYQLSGTFYISPFDHELKEHELLSRSAIREIAKDFEIGAHTMTHPDLRKLSPKEAQYEISTSKKYLEEIINRPITTFSYPYGLYTTTVKTLVKNAGFLTARTTKDFSINTPTDPFLTETTFEFCPQTTLGIYGQYKKVLLRGDSHMLAKLRFSWEQNAKNLFDHVLTTGGMYHLWGHSQVIEKYNLWGKLESLITYISRHNQVHYQTNSEIILHNI